MCKLDSRNITSILLPTIIFLFACSQGHWVHIVNDRTFTDAEEARAYHKNQIELDLAAITPSPSSLADTVIVVLPPRDQIQAIYMESSGSTGAPREFVEATIDRYEDNVLTDFEVVRRSNLFSSTELLRARNAEPSMAPPNGYLVWTEISEVEQEVNRYIIASGLDNFHKFSWKYNEPAPERIKAWIAECTAYIKEHPPLR